MAGSIIQDVSIVTLREMADERGAVLHMLREDAPDFTRFGECYMSEVVPGAIKAWKKHNLQTQKMTVPVGRMRIVLYDDRAGSTTKNLLEEHEIGRPDAYQRITIPPGIWYGFAAVGNEKSLLVNCSDIPHNPSESVTIPFNDPAIPYVWEMAK